MQGRGCLARSTISFGRESGCQLTGFGQETRTVPPSGGVSWAQVHHDRSLHLGNARVPPGSPAIEGSEDGGDGRAASGRERGQSAPHAPPGKKAPEQSVFVSRAPLRETNPAPLKLENIIITLPFFLSGESKAKVLITGYVLSQILISDQFYPKKVTDCTLKYENGS